MCGMALRAFSPAFKSCKKVRVFAHPRYIVKRGGTSCGFWKIQKVYNPPYFSGVVTLFGFWRICQYWSSARIDVGYDASNLLVPAYSVTCRLLGSGAGIHLLVQGVWSASPLDSEGRWWCSVKQAVYKAACTYLASRRRGRYLRGTT